MEKAKGKFISLVRCERMSVQILTTKLRDSTDQIDTYE